MKINIDKYGRVMLAAALIAAGIIGILLYILEPGRIASSRINQLRNSGFKSISFIEIMPFDWDVMYCFDGDYYLQNQISQLANFDCPTGDFLENPEPFIIFAKDSTYIYCFKYTQYGSSLYFNPDLYTIRDKPRRITAREAVFDLTDNGYIVRFNQ